MEKFEVIANRGELRKSFGCFGDADNFYGKVCAAMGFDITHAALLVDGDVYSETEG